MSFDPTVTVFGTYKKTKEPYYRKVSMLLERIRQCKVQALTDQLQAISDPEEKRNFKKEKFPCILFHGIFSERLDAAMSHHSGLIVLDFDKVPDLLTFKSEICKRPYVYAAWISPSGTGLKVLIRVPPVITEHRGRFAALKKEFPYVDPSGVNEGRICYDSCDADIYINTEAEEYQDYYAPETMQTVVVDNGQRKVAKDLSKLNGPCLAIRRSTDGERHFVLVKTAKAVGGYIAAGYLDEPTAIAALTSEWQAKPNIDINHCHKQIRDGIEAGKKEPIYDQDTGRTIEPKTDQTTNSTTAMSVFDEIMDIYENGHNKGETTHFRCIDPHFTWKMGETTMVSGSPNAGKSTWHSFMTLIKSVHSGWKWAVFTPESHPASDYYIELICALVGKPFDKEQPNRMSKEAVRQAIAFLDKHFFFVYPDVAHTIEEIEAEFLYLHKKHGLKGVIIDPFNQLVREKVSRDDQFLEDFLIGRKRFAKENDLHYMFVTHPKQQTKDKEGNYPVVDKYDIANGAMWINKIDNFISIYRPANDQGYLTGGVEVHVKKIRKQKLVGTPGMVKLVFNPVTSRYYYLGRSPLDNIQSDIVNPADEEPEREASYSNSFPADASSFSDTIYHHPIDTPF